MSSSTVKLKNKKLFTIDDEPMQTDAKDEGKAGMRDAYLRDAIRVLCKSLPAGKFTMDDSIKAYEIVQAVKQQPGEFFEIEQSQLDWLRDMLKAHGSLVFGINECMVKFALNAEEAKKKE
jgi:hypothetical protein